jgi:membrane protein DedA with SNARE-associated domain
VNHLIQSIAHHGYLLIFLVVLAESIGLPMPAALALVAGGAAAASHSLSTPSLILIAFMGMILGDCLLFFAGAYTGWGLLGALCRVSMNPESCILRSAESFYKRGKVTLLFAKFIPGLNTMAPPLAGSMKMRFSQFFQLDAVGAALYILAYGTVGFLFRDFLVAITRGFQAAEGVFGEVLVVAAIAYITYRVWIFRRNKVYRVVPRIEVQELAKRLSDGKSNILLVDVRSHGYYDSGAERIQGSVRLEPNNLVEELKHLSRDKDIYLYCT